MAAAPPRRKATTKPKSSSTAAAVAKARPVAAAEGSGVSVYVEGFPFDMAVGDVRKVLEGAAGGIVDIRAPTFQDTGRLRGFAHVDFADAVSAAKGIKGLDRLRIGQRYLAASLAKTAKGEKVSVPDPTALDKAVNRLFVRNLDYGTAEEEIKACFSKFGSVAAVRVTRRPDTGLSKGFGYVEFSTVEDAIKCVAAAQKEPIALSGRVLTLDWDLGRPKRSFRDAQGKAVFNNKPPKPAKRLKTIVKASGEKSPSIAAAAAASVSESSAPTASGGSAPRGEGKRRKKGKQVGGQESIEQ